MFMYSGKKLWLHDAYRISRDPVNFVKNIGNGYAVVKRKGCTSTLSVRITRLSKVPFSERKLWREC